MARLSSSIMFWYDSVFIVFVHPHSSIIRGNDLQNVVGTQGIESTTSNGEQKLNVVSKNNLKESKQQSTCNPSFIEIKFIN